MAGDYGERPVAHAASASSVTCAGSNCDNRALAYRFYCIRGQVLCLIGSFIGGSMIGAPRISYQEGDHVCTLFSSPEEQLRAAVEYIRGGLSRGERCLWVSCERSVAEFREALKKAGIDVK